MADFATSGVGSAEIQVGEPTDAERGVAGGTGEVAQAGIFGVARTTHEAGEASLAGDVAMDARGGTHGRHGAGDVAAGDDRLSHLQLCRLLHRTTGDVADIDDATVLTSHDRVDFDALDEHRHAQILSDLLTRAGLADDHVVRAGTVDLEDDVNSLDLRDSVAQRQLELVLGVDEEHLFHVYMPPDRCI